MALREDPPPAGRGSTPSRGWPTPPVLDAAAEARVAVAAQPAALAQLQGQPARLLVAVDLRSCFGLSLFAEFIANDKPLLVQYQGGYYTPIFNFYPETEFGGDFRTEAVYRDIEVRCLIISGGLEECWDDPEGVIAEVEETGTFAGEEVAQGWMIWPLIPYSYNTVNDHRRSAPSPPDGTTGWAPTTRRATCWRA
jgi:hypothetical protein